MKLQKTLFDSFEGSDREQARLAALCLPNCSGYLNCIPNRKTGQHLKSHEFAIVIKYRLGIKLFPENLKCPACFHQVDLFGDHFLHCQSGGLAILRHNVLCGQIFRLCQEGGLGPAREVPFLLNNGRRPADIYVPFLDAGRPVAIDFLIVILRTVGFGLAKDCEVTIIGKGVRHRTSTRMSMGKQPFH